MIQNILTFCVKNDLTFVEGSIPSGKLVANDINRNSIYLVTPYDEAIVKANFQTNLQSDKPTSVLGILVNGKITIDEIVPTSKSYYNLVKDWNIYEFKVPSTTLSFISRNRTGKIGINFSIEQRLVPAIKDSYGEYRGEIINGSFSDELGYYINKTIGFELDTGVDVFTYDLNDILILNSLDDIPNAQVKISAYSNRGSTPTAMYSVDPSLLNDNFETIEPSLTFQILQQVNDNTGDIVLLFQNVGVNNSTLVDLENRISVAEQDIDTAEGNITNLQGRMATSESDIDKIENGTTIVEKALRDSLGNVIKDNYVSAIYPTYNDTTDKFYIETYGVEDILFANNEVVLPKATTTKNGLMSATDKSKVDALWSLLDNNDENFVDTINELLEIFQNYPESMDIVTEFAKKVDKTTTVNGKPLSSNIVLGADEIGYDGTISGLSSTNVKTAIDELASEKSDKTYVDAQNQILDDRIDNIIVGTIEGASAQEIIDARQGEVTLGANITKVKSQLAEIATVVKYDPSITDYTNLIQSALDKKGLVKLEGEGIWNTGRLLIDDDTVLEIGRGVTLRKKDGTNHSILINKGHVNGYRNKNITVRGGKWDMNMTGNPNNGGDMSTNPQAWAGIGILINDVDNLVIENVQEIGGEHKYCYLIVNATNVRCSNIKFANNSDGLHFEPPINNLLIENLTGFTHDDTVSFTMGDYTRYALGKTGNIENVLVRNIHMDDGTAEHIKLVGDGLDGKSTFRNMRFENIRGEALISSVCILENDVVDGNTYLNNTYLENIVFSDIQPKVSGMTPVFLISATAGDVTIENCTYDQSGTSRFIRVAGGVGTLDKLTVRNVKSLTPQPIELSSFIYCSNQMEIKQLNIEDCRLDFSAITNGYVIYATNNSIKEINMSNTSIDGATKAVLFFLDGTSAEKPSFRVLNSYFKGSLLVQTTTPIDISVMNSEIVLNWHLAYFSDGGDVTYRSANSKYTRNITTSGLSSLRKFSFNGIDGGFGDLLSALTAVEGQMVRSVNDSETSGKGIYYYNGTVWEKTRPAQKTVTQNVVLGTINANTTKEVTLAIADSGPNQEVTCYPTFDLPVGLIFNAINRDYNNVRLRVANITASPIVVPDGNWLFKFN